MNIFYKLHNHNLVKITREEFYMRSFVFVVVNKLYSYKAVNVFNDYYCIEKNMKKMKHGFCCKKELMFFYFGRELK